jgi:light-harvesting protein B-800-850 alpha chain
MNQGRIWCVVSPNVGLPLLLGSVAATSLIVHACVMTHTTWMSNYWQGGSKTRTSEVAKPASVAAVAPKAEPAFVLSIAPVAGTPGKTEASFVVTVAPNPAASATTVSDQAAPPVSGSVAVAAANLK